MNLVIVANAAFDRKHNGFFYDTTLEYWKQRLEYRDIFCSVPASERRDWLWGYYLFQIRTGMMINCTFSGWLYLRSGKPVDSDRLSPGLAGFIINRIRAEDGDLAYRDYTDYEARLKDTNESIRQFREFFGGWSGGPFDYIGEKPYFS
jgi:hypothetical protein